MSFNFTFLTPVHHLTNFDLTYISVSRVILNYIVPYTDFLFIEKHHRERSNDVLREKPAPLGHKTGEFPVEVSETIASKEEAKKSFASCFWFWETDIRSAFFF